MAAKKRIGIKYCGGCNPTYERVEMIEKVRFRFGNHFRFHAHDEEEIACLILVSGCQRACAGQDLNPRNVSTYSVTGECDLEILIEWLTTLEVKGDFK